MIVVRPEDTLHKTMLLRLLSAILDNEVLSQNIYFKGGTCASCLAFLDRFSVDLDFDLKPGADNEKLRGEFHNVFKDLDLIIKDESKAALEFFLRYESPNRQRNTIKLDCLDQNFAANVYEVQFLPEINRYANCATIETMFSHKLIAPLDRWEKHKSLAGRDIYDIHYFFLHGYRYIPEIILERTGEPVKIFFDDLINFIDKNVTKKTITEDLSSLLTIEKFQKIRKVLKVETIRFLKEEKERVG